MADLKLGLTISLKDKLSSPLARTQTALAKLKAQTEQLNGFAKLRNSTISARQAMQAHNATTAALAQKMREAGRPSAALSLKFNESKVAAALATKTYKEQRLALTRLRTQLHGAGIDTSRLASRQAAQAKQMRGLQIKEKLLVGAGKIGSVFGGLAKIGGFATVAAAGIGLLANRAYALAKPFINTTAAFERYGIMLEGIEGSTEKAKASMKWIEDFATKTPMDVDGVTQAFIQMRNFGLDPTNGSLQSLVDMNARMGGSAENLQGMILALGQAWTAGSLKGQDIMQLINRGVPVWDLLSKMTGKSAAELQKLSSQGYLGREAIAAFIDEMGTLSNGAAQAQMKSFDGLVSNLGDHWDGFKRRVMDSGPFQMIKDKLAGLLSTLDAMTQSGELQQWADRTGEAIIKTFNGIERAINLAVATARFFGWVLDGLAAIGEVLYWPFKKIGELINWIIEKLDNLTGSGIGNVIGRGMAMLMAGLGNDDAKAALDAEISTKYAPSQELIANRPKREPAPTAKVQIAFDATGMPRMKAASPNQSLELETMTGRNLVGAGL